jgi:hypothetical protein
VSHALARRRRPAEGRRRLRPLRIAATLSHPRRGVKPADASASKIAAFPGMIRVALRERGARDPCPRVASSSPA